MSCNIRHFSATDDYRDAYDWWTKNDWQPLPLTHLSSTGFVVEIGGKKAVMGWVYETNSAFCLLEFIIANPEVRRLERTEAFNALINHVIYYTENLRFKSIFLSTRSEGLMGRLEKHGFARAETGMTHMIKNRGQ